MLVESTVSPLPLALLRSEMTSQKPIRVWLHARGIPPSAQSDRAALLICHITRESPGFITGPPSPFGTRTRPWDLSPPHGANLPQLPHWVLGLRALTWPPLFAAAVDYTSAKSRAAVEPLRIQHSHSELSRVENWQLNSEIIQVLSSVMKMYRTGR